MQTAHHTAMVSRIAGILQQYLAAEAFEFVQQKAAAIASPEGQKNLYMVFAMVPRKTGHPIVHASNVLPCGDGLPAGLHVDGWPADRLARVYLLLHLPAHHQQQYCATIENLFAAAEMNELVALYSALPVLAWPPQWVNRCTEGIRSNIGTVLEAIMYHNPYPAAYLPEPAWNQLVLKAFFTDKDINRMIGIDERANAALAATLVDYANERAAAGRHVNPQLWRFVGPFITNETLPYFERLLQSTSDTGRQAAAQACAASSYLPAQQLLHHHPHLLRAIQAGTISWKNL